ncbi:MAG: hypothetical protein V5A43_08670 [Haloarculaceae archaeon]
MIDPPEHVSLWPPTVMKTDVHRSNIGPLVHFDLDDLWVGVHVPCRTTRDGR